MHAVRCISGVNFIQEVDLVRRHPWFDYLVNIEG